MRLLWVVWCGLLAWACRALPQIEWEQQQQQQQQEQVHECEVYGAGLTAASSVDFQRRISIGVLPLKSVFTAKLNLQSTTTTKNCNLIFMKGSITPMCDDKLIQGQHNLPDEILSEGDTTELWLEVARASQGSFPAAWDLRVVVRKGNHRAHMLLPNTGLQPPVSLWLDTIMDTQYYFNCITGCLFEKSLEMPPGDHTFYLRHDQEFVQMTIDCGEDTRGGLSKQLLINVTEAELGPAGGLKKVKVMFNNHVGNIGVVVDDGTADDPIQYGSLGDDRQVKVKVAEDSGGLVTSCDPRFQKVAGGSDVEAPVTTTSATTTTKTTTESPTTSTPTPHISSSQLTDDAHHQPHQQPSSAWIPAVFTFVLLNFIVIVAAISLAIFLYCRSSSAETWNFSKDASDAPTTFTKRTSTRSSTRSGHRGSQRLNKTQSGAAQDAPASPSGESIANSETVTTPLTTPDALAQPRVQRQLSTDEFINLSLI